MIISACSAVRYFLEMASDLIQFHVRCQISEMEEKKLENDKQINPEEDITTYRMRIDDIDDQILGIDRPAPGGRPGHWPDQTAGRNHGGR